MHPDEFSAKLIRNKPTPTQNTNITNTPATSSDIKLSVNTTNEPSNLVDTITNIQSPTLQRKLSISKLQQFQTTVTEQCEQISSRPPLNDPTSQSNSNSALSHPDSSSTSLIDSDLNACKQTQMNESIEQTNQTNLCSPSAHSTADSHGTTSPISSTSISSSSTSSTSNRASRAPIKSNELLMNSDYDHFSASPASASDIDNSQQHRQQRSKHQQQQQQQQ